ncbi:MAG: Holliday junction branch migration protein RuvA [Lachnospiraceae bacterium]|nr:Holliday junction branch migration protein RuvA [Lachnospiraceae bacterium]
MISIIKGEVAETAESSIIVETGGIGFSVAVPSSVAASVSAGDAVKLYTHMNVTENDICLYGFLTRDDLSVFKQLITVSGVGPKGALGILSGLGADQLRLAVIAQDAKAISKAPGVGPKTAQRIILELKDKLDLEKVLEHGTVSGADLTENANVNDAVMALVVMGYSRTEAISAVRQCDIKPDATTDEILKMALRAIF